jgi:putative ABC transport system substrate-binding protein
VTSANAPGTWGTWRRLFNEPSGNITGVSWFGSNLVAKKLELLLQLVPDAAVVALLLNPNNAEVALQSSEFEQAVSTLGRQFHILNAGSEAEIDSAFAALVERRVGALVEGSDPFLFSRRRQIIALAARHAIPTIHPNRESVADGGLMSYGNSLITLRVCAEFISAPNPQRFASANTHVPTD